jgi:hypothetical protein
MDLLLNLDQQDGVWIDGSHRVFEKTEFDGLGFRVKIKPLTRTELRRIRKESQTAKGVDGDLVMPKIFAAHVIDWEIKDSKGEQIPFTDENRKVICESFPGFANLIAAACMDSNAQTVSEDEVKNS